jgi:predicted XRE-type DNA-binding protein
VTGKIDDFTIDSLVNMLAHAGVPIELRIPVEASTASADQSP